MNTTRAMGLIWSLKATYRADPEVGHINEDRLIWQVIKHIAAGSTNAQELCQLLVTELYEDRRTQWYA